MNITFLIGNGFDLNLGLNTRYNDFLEYYGNPERKKTALIEEFTKDILKRKELWSSAEVAFGEYTDSFDGVEKTVENYCDCHEDFCNKLAKYLDKEQEYVDLINADCAKKFISAIFKLAEGFREEPTAIIKKAIEAFSGGYNFHFISYNYTRTIDHLYNLAKKSTLLGTRVRGNTTYQNKIGALEHVHGYTDRDMVLGVNDISQIKNKKLFENQDEEYINQIIKRETNRVNEQRTDEKTHAILQNSDIIYIYGMSIGQTDAIWWERICAVLSQKKNSILIVHAFDAPEDRLIRRSYRRFERNRKQEILDYSQLSEDEQGELIPRIFITGTNIFSDFKMLATAHNTASELLSVRKSMLCENKKVTYISNFKFLLSEPGLRPLRMWPLRRRW